MQEQELQSITLSWGNNSPLQIKIMTVGLMVIKKIFSKSFEILYISSLSIFLKETALKYTLEAGGLMIVVLKLDYGKQTVGISGRPLSLFQGPLCLAILFFWHKKVGKYPYSIRVNWSCRNNDDFGLQLRQGDRSQVTKL